MATLGAYVLTLADFAKRLGPDDKVADIIEMLSQTNEVLQDMLWKEGNLPTGHRTTIRTGLPTVAWRLLNQGVQPSKSTTAQVDEQCGILEAWCEIDKDLAELNGNTAAFRLSEAMAFIEAMNQEMASTLFYGNASVSPEEFTGLAIRYSATSAASGQNIVLGGGAGSDNSSIYLVVWGENTVHGIYPKGSKAGLSHFDHGLVTVETSTGIGGTRLRAYQDQFQWKCGVALKDWRYVVRIPNIDISNLVAKSSAADLFDLMIKAIHRIPSLKMGKPVFYMNRSCFQMLDIQGRDDVVTGGGLKFENVAGMMQYSFRGIPVRICDALLENEAVVS
jgi:hypothetical protein